MKKRLLGIMLCIMLVLSLLPTTVMAETSVSYIDSKGVLQTYTGNYTTVGSASTAWDAGWYVVSGSVTIADRIIVSGDVHLVLTDGCTLNANAGIQVSGDGNFLTIYGQSKGTGKLIAKGSDYTAGIGGTGAKSETASTASSGKITINGGYIEATGGSSAAGIGGGKYGNGSNITINGGTVIASGGKYGAGIGGGNSGGMGENIIVNGGVVKASGGDSNSAGIGGGHNGIGKNITITGGTVTANGAVKGGAGIGGGSDTTNGIVTQILISGGNVTASGGESSAGIGGGSRESVDGITISGGEIEATGGINGPGIGSGLEGNAKNITITGGSVTARGYHKGGAGIGAGKNGSVNGIIIRGGTVIAIGGKSDDYGKANRNDKNKQWLDKSYAGGAGIGLGDHVTSAMTDTQERIKNIVISGSAKVYVQGGKSTNTNAYGAGIGYDGFTTDPNGNKEVTPDTSGLFTTGFVKYYTPGVDMSNAEPLETSIYGVVQPPSATVGDVTISGLVGTAITGTDVTLVLTNDTFKSELAADTDVSSWFNLPGGLAAKIKSKVSADATEATITVSGTPKAVSSAAMTITIPAANLTSGADLTVTSNANAKFAIGKGTLAADFFDFTAPANLIYDGTDKTATVTLKSAYTDAGKVTVKYEKGGNSVNETKDMGTYKVKIDVAAGKNYNAAENLTSDDWTFTIAPPALTGTVSISGTAKYDETLTADTTGITNNTGTLSYEWYRDSDKISGATGSTYKLVADDIGKTITVKVTSSVQTGEISSAATSTVEKADGPAAPAAFTLGFALNDYGQTFTATIPTVEGGEYSFDGTNYSEFNTKTDCAANTAYTGYVRIAATSTHKAGTATSDTQTSPKLTVATPTFTPDGTSSFSGTQSVTISCATAGAKIYYTTDGTEPTSVGGTEYTAPLSLTATTTIKAIAVGADMIDSAVATATFTKRSSKHHTTTDAVSTEKTENHFIDVNASDYFYDAVLWAVGKGITEGTDELHFSPDDPCTRAQIVTFLWRTAGSPEPESAVNPFTDVAAGSYYEKAVLWAIENGITKGTSASEFAPNATCTRAQGVAFLYRATGATASGSNSFSDVPAGAYYSDAVTWAEKNAVTGGIGGGLFGSDDPCTRAQIVTFLFRAYDK